MKKLRITIGNKSYDVTVEDLTEPETYGARPAQAQPAPHAPLTNPAPAAAARPSPRPQLPIDAGAVTSPMAGVIKSILVKAADPVKERQPLVVLEAMKMENQITAPAAGTVKSVDVAEGESVQEGQVLVVLE